jgi:cellulose synthase/poly-beta-1,6-N-acetylglucosamine synthase-like glycosyltransferase
MLGHPSPVGAVIVILYFFAMFGFSLYGAHRLYLLYLYRKHRGPSPEPPTRFSSQPTVTIQLPIYNERYVVRRLVESVCRIDYPHDRLEIQLLDDSTDETVDIAAEIVAEKQAEGFPITHVRRGSREGFKAGALAYGLEHSRGEFILILDADFVPQPDVLRRTIDHFTDEKIGMVQARWGHLNEDYSPLTQIQSLLLDGHFVVEHTARSRTGRYINFNGTAGLWRRRAIEEAGGWQGDTLTEDMDLSYRAQLAGWKFLFLPETSCPAELPVTVSGLKSQQHRWTKGAIQTARKLLPTILRAPVPIRVKFEATMHLCSNFAYLLMIIPAVLAWPLLVYLFPMKGPLLFVAYSLIFFFATISVCIFYMAAQRELHPDWARKLRYLPFLMAMGIGMTVNNSRAVVEGILGHRSEFTRTPKYGITKKRERWSGKAYRARKKIDFYVEAGFAAYFTATVVFAVFRGLWTSLPFLILFQVGFAVVAYMTFVEGGGSILPRLRARTGTG